MVARYKPTHSAGMVPLKVPLRRKRSRSKQKEKGSAFERDVCVRLSLWVSRGEERDLFWRSAMSGGRASRGIKRGEKLRRQAGDICAVAPEGHGLTNTWYIELKHYAKLDIAQFFLTGTGRLAKFWRETEKAALVFNRHPMLIARQNHTITLLIVSDMRREQFCGVKPLALSNMNKAAVFSFIAVLGSRYG